jgi:hypothetical protein
MNKQTGFKSWLPWIVAVICVIIIFHISYGLSALQPSNVSWLMTVRHDWGTHYLGWAFYKNEPWHFPLGNVDGYNYPVGTNVGYTDSIPFLAIFFKLFAPLLSSDFQYFGIWLFLCHLLAAYFTIRLLRVFKVNWVITIAASVFIAANPVLLYRGMHPALCGHWMLIAGIYFYFLDKQSSNWKKILLYQFLLASFSATINPYLCAMVMGFSFATPTKLCFYKKYFSWKYLLAYIAVSVFSVSLLWFITGIVSFGDQENFGITGAYGLYGFNLNGLFNSAGYSPILPQLKQVSWHQYEGYMYLGVGMLLLLMIFILYSAFNLIVHRINKKETIKVKLTKGYGNLPLWILILSYTIFATTFVFTFNDKVLVRIPVPEFFKQLEEIFRASARFFWLPYYLIILFTIIGLAKSRIKPIISTSVIILALAIQLYDVNRLLTSKNMTYGAYNPPMQNANWIKLMSQFDEVLFFPAFNSPGIKDMAYQDFSYLALKAGKPVNLAYVAREDSRALKNFSDSLTETVASGVLSPKALYITDSAHLSYFSKAILSHSAFVGPLDGCFYIFSVGQQKTSMNDSPEKGSNDILANVLKKSHPAAFVIAGSLPVVDNGAIRYNIESMNIKEAVVSLNGWAFIDSSQNNTNDSIFISLISHDQSYLASVATLQREDVAGGFSRPNLANCGFGFLAFTDNVKPGIYQIGLAIKDAKGRFVFQTLGRAVRIKKSEFVVPVKINKLPPAGKIVYDLIIEENATSYSAAGWAAVENQDADSSTINLVLKNNGNIYILSTESSSRPDVTASFNNKYKLNNSGYTVKFLKATLPKGRYQIGFLIQEARRKTETVLFTEKEINNL